MLVVHYVAMIKYLRREKLVIFTGDVVFITVSFLIVPYLRFGVLPNPATLLTTFDTFTIAIFLLMFYIFDLYNPDDIKVKARLFLRLLVSISLSFLFISTLFFVLNIRPFGSITIILNALCIFFLCLGWRLMVMRWINLVKSPLNLAILGKNKAGEYLAEKLSRRSDYHFKGFLDDFVPPGADCSENPDRHSNLSEYVFRQNIEEVVVSDTNCMTPSIRDALKRIKIAGMDVFELPVFYELAFRQIPVRFIDESWFVFSRISGVSRSVYNIRLKRLIDICISSILLVLFLPFMPIIAAAIKLDSPGPVLFSQKRVGLNGQRFKLYKFRSMVHGREDDRSFAGQKNDPRITRVGRWLRFFRLDELPQLWNVLMGDMSLIGPRALMEEEVAEFTEKVPFFSLRHSVRPGITGWAQVNYRHGTTLEDALIKLEYDLYYIKNLSPALDLLILARTIRTVLFGRGAR